MTAMSLQESEDMEHLKRFKESQDVKIEWRKILDSESYKLIMGQCEQLSCATELVLFPLLTSIAHFMGTKATVKIDSDWLEPTSLMCLLVARRGERKTCALHRTKQSCVALENEINAMRHLKDEIKECSDTKPISLVDQHNIHRDLNTALKNSNEDPLLIIIDDFRETLSHIDETTDIFTNSKLKDIYGCGVTNDLQRHLNFIGTIQASDVHSVFRNRERIAMFDRSLIVCCKNFVEPTKDKTTETNSMKTILSAVRNYHSLQTEPLYTFSAGGQTEFSRCMGIFQRMKRIYTDNRMVFGSINQAGGHLARLSAILTALRNGVAMGNNSTYLPSIVIDNETVKRAYQIVRFVLQQKLCLFASKSDDEWPEVADDSNNTEWMAETDNQSEKSGNVTTSGNYVDDYDDDDVIEITQNNGRVERIIAGKSEMHVNSYEREHFSASPQRLFTGNEMVVMKNRSSQSRQTTDVIFETGRQEVDNRLMEYFVPITSSVPEMPRNFGAPNMSSHIHNVGHKSSKSPDTYIPPHQTTSNSKTKVSSKAARPYQKCLPAPFEGNIYDADEEIFFQQCANKIKKLLLTQGAAVTASYACQYRLFPPVPMDMRQKSPRTSHPSWAASRFFERLEGLEIGTMHVLRGHSVRFLKEPYSKMSERAKDVLRRLRVHPDEYNDTFPESAMSVYEELKMMQSGKDGIESDMQIVFNNQ